MKGKSAEESYRMIHIRLPKEVHKRLRVCVAELDTTIQDWVAELVIRELERQEKLGEDNS